MDWTLLGTRPISDHRIFRLRYDRYRAEPSGPEHDFVVLECPDWVNVVPLTDDGKVVLVRQYRHGVRRMSLEVPGGMVDPGESPEAAARRELREEAGYVPRRLRLLARLYANSAFQDNHCYLYAAEGCRPEGGQHLDPLERMQVELHPQAAIPELVRSGEISHALIVTSLALLGLATPFED